MKKTHSANIGGTVFHIEEDAYEKLQDYLQSIHAHFHFYPDVAEIVTDIEGRIAEQLQQREMASQVVRMNDVERVIEAMGRIEQFDEPATKQVPPAEGRKLFCDPEHRIIAGVAAGLASYLGVPRLLVRLAFLALVFVFGIGAITYLLLWALVPMASSTTDKLQMRGRPLTLASIDQGVRDGFASIPRETRNMAAQGVTALGSLIHLVVVTIARALKWVAGVFVVGIASLGMLFLTISLVVALVDASAPPLHQFAAGFFAAFGAWQHVFKVCAYLVMAVPLALVIATGLKLFWGANRLNTHGLTGLLAVWVVALLAATGIWSSRYPQLHQYWDEYPSMAEARNGLERFSAILATASPLSDDQSHALLATLTAESRRWHAEDDRFRGYFPRTRLDLEEEALKARDESNRRVVEAARSYLDAQQLALMEESMTRYSTRTQAALQARRERFENSRRDAN